MAPGRALAVALVFCLGSFAVGCGGDDDEDQAGTPGTGTQPTETEAAEPDQDAGDFLKEVVEQRALGQHGRVWETLHPLHQAVVSRTEYMNCESQETLGAELVDIEEVDEYDEPLQIPGQTTEVPSKAVTLRIEYKVPAFEDTQTETATAHAVAEDGEWRWILTNEDYEAYEAGECPPSE